MINQFSVKNYKALESVSIPLTPIHVVIGQNDSGKTSLLEAIHAYCSSTQGPLVNAFPGMWEGRELVHFGAGKPLVEMSARLVHEGRAPLEYELGIDFSRRLHDCMQEYERFSFGRGDSKDLTSHQPGWTAVGHRDNAPEHLKNDLNLIADLVGSSRFYRLDARMMAIPAAFDSPRRFRMDRDGFGLPTLLDDILGYDPERYIALRKDFCTHFPEFRTIHVRTEQAARRDYGAYGAPGNFGTGDLATGKGIYF